MLYYELDIASADLAKYNESVEQLRSLMVKCASAPIDQAIYITKNLSLLCITKASDQNLMKYRSSGLRASSNAAKPLILTGIEKAE